MAAPVRQAASGTLPQGKVRLPRMAPSPKKRKSPYTADRNIPGAFEGETVTRRGLMTSGALAVGGLASAAFGLPALGFALGPSLSRTEPHRWQDVGPEADFGKTAYTQKIIDLVANVGDSGKTTIYVRKYDPAVDGKKNSDLPYVAISNRCMHLGCPVRYVQAAQRFICPCHGGVYGPLGEVTGGPPVRPLDRFYTKVENGRVMVGARFSLDSHFRRFPHPRDPSNHLDGLWKYLYPARPTT
jgi:menaquinol-cytochrome c reductase iron-sulfur subunit